MNGRICLLALILMLSAFSQSAAAATAHTQQTDIVVEMGASSESLVDALISKNQTLAGKHYLLLKSDLDRLHTMSATMDFNERRTRELFTAYSWMRLISIDMHAGEWTGAAIAANQMGGEIIRFTDFPTLSLRDVAWMDYLGRDVMLLSMEDMQGNLQTIELRKNELGETWKRVREEMLRDFRNKTLVMQGDQLISDIEQANNSRTLISLSQQEHVFVQQIQAALLSDKK